MFLDVTMNIFIFQVASGNSMLLEELTYEQMRRAAVSERLTLEQRARVFEILTQVSFSMLFYSLILQFILCISCIILLL